MTFKKMILLLVLIGMCFVFTVAGSTGPGDSEPVFVTIKPKITEVTVFADQAQVTRTAAKQLAPGQYRFLVEPLPRGIEKDTIQVKGSANVVLQEFRFKSVTLSSTADGTTEAVFTKEIKKLESQNEILKEQLDELSDKITEAEKEKKFIQKIVDRVTKSSGKSEKLELNPDGWIKMVNFYRSKNEALNKEIRENRVKRRKITKKRDKLTEEIEEKEEEKENLLERKINRLEVLARVTGAGEARLTLSYITQGPSWVPDYDLHVSYKKRKVRIYYNAKIRQKTGEDWNRVPVKLSTAEPDSDSSHPSLSPWHISLLPPLPPSPKNSKFDKGVEGGVVGGVLGTVAGNNMYNVAPAEFSDGDDDPAEASTVDEHGISAVFTLKGRQTIKSDGRAHRIQVMSHTFDGYFRYSTVPKLSETAFLKVKIKNKSKFHLLPGNANIFLDNSFVSRSRLDFVAPDASFWTFLGPDKTIKIAYTYINRKRKQKGKKTILTYESLVEVKNNKGTPEELVIWDRLPMSRDKKLKVTMLEPLEKPRLVRGSGEAEVISKGPMLIRNQMDYLEWFFKLKPGETLKVPLKFTVEYPRDFRPKGF